MKRPSATGDTRPVVLMTYRYFSEQHDAQGPTQSLLRIVQSLSHRFRFRIVSMAMPGEEVGRWGTAFGVERIGIPSGLRGIRQVAGILRKNRHDLLVLNSFFDPQLTIAPLLMRKLGLVPRTPVLIAPRGEFSPGALALKSAKKRAYLRASRNFLFDDASFQATDPLEADVIRAELPNASPILVAPNIRAIEPLPQHLPREPGTPLRIAFLSRIDRKKNLDLALRLVADSGVAARFDIIGPVHDPAYWRECQRLIASMPPSVAIRHLGAVAATDVVRSLAGYDLFLFPTAGENYGHVIVEALMAGTPVMISDQTPWRNLASDQAGADLPLADISDWLGLIRRFAAMTREESEEWRKGARAYVQRSLRPDEDVAKVRACLETAMRDHGPGNRD